MIECPWLDHSWLNWSETPFCSLAGDASRLVVIITDGKHTTNEHGYTDPRNIAQDIRDQGADILVVAVGDELDDEFLRGIAGDASIDLKSLNFAWKT